LSLGAALLGALGACTAVVGGEQGAAPPVAAAGAGGTATWMPGMTEPSALVATPRVVRLSRPQWENSVRALLQVGDISAITAQVTGDALVGLDNEAEALRVGPQLRADLEKAAFSLAELAAGDPTALARLIPADAPAAGIERRDAFITAFGLRAFRRPLTSDEQATYQQLFNQGPNLYPTDDAFVAGSKLLVAAILQSPYFLYRTELSTQVVQGRVPLSDYEVAAKLALSLTSTLPDAELLATAAQGKLRDKTQILDAAERLLGTPAGAKSRDQLHFQFYRLGAYDGIVRDAQVFPDFSAATPPAMREEVLRFLAYVFEQGRGVEAIFTTPVGFVNDTLAPLYGLPKTFGPTLTQVDLNPAERSGLLTLPGFLSSYAIVNDPDTIHRGVFVNQRILCRDLPPPDPNATVLVPLDPGMTNRERVEATTGPGTCGQGCHSTIINPPGFAFEHFDPIGRYRTEDRGKPINSASSYAFADGEKSFDGAVEFSHLLAASPEVHACYIEGWMSYMNGHPLESSEQPLLDYLTGASLAGDLTLHDLVLRLVSADGFLNRLP
jgi:hypothetical protein